MLGCWVCETCARALGTSLSVSCGANCPPDSLAELKRKFKDVLRAYWRQHKSNHDGEDTEQYEVAHRIATSIFNLYWDKPNYAGLRGDKKEIMNYFIKHIQLSKSREGQSSNPLLRSNHTRTLPGFSPRHSLLFYPFFRLVQLLASLFCSPTRFAPQTQFT